MGDYVGQDQGHIFEEAEITQVGEHEDIGQPTMFIGEVETIGMLFKYGRIWESFQEIADSSAGYLENEFGVPYPFNYIVFVLTTICSLYISNLLRTLLFPKKPKESHVFNTVDAVDMSKLMRVLENIEKQGSTSGGKVAVSIHIIL